MRLHGLICLSVAAWITTLDTACAADAAPEVIANFQLRDFRGKLHALDDYADATLVVVAFWGTECPLAKLYAARLAELAKRHGSGEVAFLAVFSNQQDSLEELGHFARKYGIDFPVLKDVGNVVADQFGAVRTPELFVLDRARVVRYRGRVDDQYDVGIQRPGPLRSDLAEAIDELLAGREVSVPRTRSPGCLIGRVKSVDETADVSWSKQIAEIFQRRCQECHRPGEIGPFPLISYEDTQGWGPMIAEVVGQERMPPWFANPNHGNFSNDARLSNEEKELIFAWVAAGQPQGDLSEAPPPRKFHSDWRIAEPDAIVYMSDKPFDVPAEGTVDYQWYFADPGFTEDTWIKAAEAKPGSPDVVHHVTIYIKPPDIPFSLRMNDRISLLAGFNPGGGPWRAPEEMAVKIPAGAELVFEMHYTPNGTPQKDRSYVGLKFADPATVRKQIMCVMPANTEFEIPPRAHDFKVQKSWYFPADSLLLVMRPHMHLRGKAFRYEAIYPDGTNEILLDVPNFDFNWQNNYVFATPKQVPAGTEMRCTAWFDNSEDNLSNPDPSATVRWGDQTIDEMMIGIFAMALVDQDLLEQTSVPVATSRRGGWISWAMVALFVMAIGVFVVRGRQGGSHAGRS